ncbi:hypothetical protein D3C71_2008010 [compost metagenome]
MRVLVGPQVDDFAACIPRAELRGDEATLVDIRQIRVSAKACRLRLINTAEQRVLQGFAETALAASVWAVHQGDTPAEIEIFGLAKASEGPNS